MGMILCLPSSRCRSAGEERVVGVVSRVASLPSLSGNRPVSRWPAGEHARRLSALLPSFSFHPQLLLPSKSNFLSREIPLASFFLILGAIYFQEHANYKLHNMAREIGSRFTKPLICWKSTLIRKRRPGMMSKAKLYEILHLKGSRSSIEGTWDEYQPLPC